MFRFYSYGLEKKFREHIFQDFQELALWDYHRGHLYGLEKFWAFLHYSPYKEPISYDPELELALRPFSTAKDFESAAMPVSLALSLSLSLPLSLSLSLCVCVLGCYFVA